MLFFLAVLTTLLASSSSQNLKNDKPTCMFQQNQTDFNPCVFNTLGGADNQVAACAYFLNTATYQQCLCTKSKAVTEWYNKLRVLH